MVQVIKLNSNNQDQIEENAIKLPRPLDLKKIVKRRSLPGMVKRLSVLYVTEQNILSEEKGHNDYQTLILFHAINTKDYIENNDNRYLLAGITKDDNEVYVFRFKSPDYVEDIDDILSSDVRYWSFNFGMRLLIILMQSKMKML